MAKFLISYINIIDMALSRECQMCVSLRASWGCGARDFSSVIRANRIVLHKLPPCYALCLLFIQSLSLVKDAPCQAFSPES